MTLRKKFFFTVFLVCLFSSLYLFQPFRAEGGEPRATYNARAKGTAIHSDFVRARENAVAQAKRLAVDGFLRDIVDEGVYASHEKALKNIMLDGERYVRSYRFLYVEDNIKEEASEVELEVTLYTEALRRKLGTLGIIDMPPLVGVRTLVVLINENDLSADKSASFWDKASMAENILVKLFVAAGIKVVSRDSVRHKFNDDTFSRAVKGEVGAAVEIGQKAGADIVIVGNAVSTLLDEGAGAKPVQVSISLKAISALRSKVVAAKTDSMAIKKAQMGEAEAEAYDKVSRKLGEFFVTSVQRFWGGGGAAQSETPTPSAPAPAAPRPTDDL